MYKVPQNVMEIWRKCQGILIPEPVNSRKENDRFSCSICLLPKPLPTGLSLYLRFRERELSFQRDLDLGLVLSVMILQCGGKWPWKRSIFANRCFNQPKFNVQNRENRLFWRSRLARLWKHELCHDAQNQIPYKRQFGTTEIFTGRHFGHWRFR